MSIAHSWNSMMTNLLPILGYEFAIYAHGIDLSEGKGIAESLGQVQVRLRAWSCSLIQIRLSQCPPMCQY